MKKEGEMTIAEEVVEEIMGKERKGEAKIKGRLEGVEWWEEANEIWMDGKSIGICYLLQEALGHKLKTFRGCCPQENEIEVEITVKTIEKIKKKSI